MTNPRIVSLLPSLTEVVCALGFEKNLVGRSHECDFPHSISHLPVLCEPKYSVDENTPSGDIHQSVIHLLQNGLSVYKVDDEKLTSLKPDIILTQDHCEVCAVSFQDLENAINRFLDKNVNVVSVSPINLEQVIQSFLTIANALDAGEKGQELVKQMKNGFSAISDKTDGSVRPTVVSIEWLDPLMTGGNWMPELIEIAGGQNLLSEAGKHSPWCDWETILNADPDILLLLPCGFSINKTLTETDSLTSRDGWNQLKAVQNNRVYILDGNQYFNRPGPRLLDSAEILAEIFYPDLFPPRHQKTGWVKFDSRI
jgi:iron complex transport system substrate-binding protein